MKLSNVQAWQGYVLSLFHDKYDLMDQIILYKSAAIIKSVIAQMKNINTDNKMEAIDQLTFFVDAIIDYMIENKEMLSVISEKAQYCIR